MKKNVKTPLTEKYLESLEGIAPAEPKDFFYARIKQRIRTDEVKSELVFHFKPAMLITILTILLLLNIVVLAKHGKAEAGSHSSIKDFAMAYDQSLSGIY